MSTAHSDNPALLRLKAHAFSRFATDSQDAYNPAMASPTDPSPLPIASAPTAVPEGAQPLTDLPAGGTGGVVKIDEADHAMLIRLKTMGMHEGRAVRVVRRGTRIIVSCGGTRIGLSAEVAKHVLVTQTT